MLSKSQEDKLEEKIHPGIHKEVAKMAKKHKFTHTHVEHHEDGSHTVHHVHKDGPEHDVKGAVADHDGLMDHMMDHTSAPNPGEAEANAGPAAGAPAAMPPMGGGPAAA